MSVPTPPTQPSLSWDPTYISNAAGTDLLLSIGTPTGNGTVASPLVSIGMVSAKMNAKLDSCFKRGVIRGGVGRAALAEFFGSADPKVKCSLLHSRLKDRLMVNGRNYTSELTSAGTAPNIVQSIGITPSGVIAERYQCFISTPAPIGFRSGTLMWLGSFTRNEEEDEYDKDSTEPVMLGFELHFFTDPGAQATGQDPLGIIYHEDVP